MAEVIPRAKLIAFLRNPVDRTYSAYHHQAKNRQQTRTFEEVVEACFDAPHRRFLSQSIYVDHLLRWSRYFSDEQMLVLKSEDFFEHPRRTLELVLEYLGLPDWEPHASEFRDQLNKGKYERGMDPGIRRRLEEYFEPHNRRLYEYLGVDFGWWKEIGSPLIAAASGWAPSCEGASRGVCFAHEPGASRMIGKSACRKGVSPRRRNYGAGLAKPALERETIPELERVRRLLHQGEQQLERTRNGPSVIRRRTGLEDRAPS
jgi:hypothetical protein